MRARRLLTFGVLALGALTLRAEGDDTPPRSVVLITVDTYRGDHLHTERAGRSVTPQLDRIAATAVRFPNAWSVSNATSAGTAGILTGLFPHRSGVLRNNHFLDPKIPTLATRLRDAGYRTAAFVSNPVLARGSGFEHGFDEYTQIAPAKAETGRRPAKARASAVTDAALAWLETTSRDAPLFLWVHLMEPHGPYEPPAEAADAFPRDAFDAPRDVALLQNNSGHAGIPKYQQVSAAPEHAGDARDYLARYAAEVWDLDRELGGFANELVRLELWDDAVVVLSSDHGEALADDHGFFFSHANGMTQDQVHVPLLLRFPGCDAGSVIDAPVSTVDILPTVLACAGVADAAAGELDGTHLLESGARTVACVLDDESAVREGAWKLWRTPEDKRVLTNLDDDPSDSHNVAGEFPKVLQRLTRRLDAIAAWKPLATPVVRSRAGRGGR